jgi:hypothetical protein
MRTNQSSHYMYKLLSTSLARLVLSKESTLSEFSCAQGGFRKGTDTRMIPFNRGSVQSFRLYATVPWQRYFRRSVQDRSLPLIYYQQHVLQLTHPMKTALYPEAEFLEEIQTKVLKVFFPLRYLQSPLQLCLEIYISSNSHNIWFKKSMQKPQAWELKIMPRKLNEIVHS